MFKLVYWLRPLELLLKSQSSNLGLAKPNVELLQYFRNWAFKWVLVTRCKFNLNITFIIIVYYFPLKYSPKNKIILSTSFEVVLRYCSHFYNKKKKKLSLHSAKAIMLTKVIFHGKLSLHLCIKKCFCKDCIGSSHRRVFRRAGICNCRN